MNHLTRTTMQTAINAFEKQKTVLSQSCDVAMLSLFTKRDRSYEAEQAQNQYKHSQGRGGETKHTCLLSTSRRCPPYVFKCLRALVPAVSFKKWVWGGALVMADVYFAPEIYQNISERLTTTHKIGHFIVHYTHAHIPTNFQVDLLYFECVAA